MTRPPPIPRQARGFGSALKLNFFLPGAGLVVLGHPFLGYCFAGSFLLCFGAVLILFLAGYAQYLSTALGGDLLQGDRLEQIGAGFHTGWVMTLAVVGVVIYAASMIMLLVIRSRRNKEQGRTVG